MYFLPFHAMSSILVEEAKKKAVGLKLHYDSSGPDIDFLPRFTTVKEITDFAEKNAVTVLDLTFADVPGTLQHTSFPLHECTEKNMERGFGFDGSSIRGFQEIQESDMLLMPDIATTFLDTFSAEPTLSMICDVVDPTTGELYGNSPRTIAKRATQALKKSGIADTAYFGPEAEFFIFDSVRYDQKPGSGYYKIDSEEAVWNSGTKEEGGNQGYKIRHKEGYFPGPPMDKHQSVRSEMVRELERAGIAIECSHHEVATAGQAEIDMLFTDLLSMGDSLMRYKYIVRNVANRFGKSVTFMPKPIYNDNGSGMHVHQSLWKNEETLFAGEGYAGLSDIALHYIGGIIAHAPALCALCNPTTNSYKRLVPGFEAPVNFIYSARNRTAAIRIPMYHSDPKSKRIEARFPDPVCNPYLAFSALMLAGLDGIRKEMDPGKATDKNLYSLPEAELSAIPRAPHSLGDALRALEEDSNFLTEDGVFSSTFLQDYIGMKRAEIAEGSTYPTPWEFYRYYDM